jgi:hypothetical protein
MRPSGRSLAPDGSSSIGPGPSGEIGSSPDRQTGSPAGPEDRDRVSITGYAADSSSCSIALGRRPHAYFELSALIPDAGGVGEVQLGLPVG